MAEIKLSSAAQASFEDLPLHDFMGVKIVAAGDGKAELRVPIHAHIINPAGVFHGVMHHALCDMAASIAAWTLLEEDVSAVTSNVNIAILATTDRGEVRAQAELIKQGKRQLVLETRLYDDQANLLSTGQVTKVVLNPKS